MVIVKKKIKDIHRILDRLLARNERIMVIALAKWFDFTIKQIRAVLTTKFIKKDITSELTDWDFIDSKGVIFMKPAVAEVMEAGAIAGYKIVGSTEVFDMLNVDAVNQVNKVCADMVREVTNETKKAIRFHIKQGIKEGKGMDKVARELRPLVGLTENQLKSVHNYRVLLEEKVPKVPQKVIDGRVGAYERKTHRRRALTIARTETANAQNTGYCMALEESGVTKVELSAAPGACKICAGLNGKKYGVREGRKIISVHPNCRCAMLPIIG